MSQTGISQAGMSEATHPVLSVEGLEVGFRTRGGAVEAVRDISFAIAPGETLGLIGESGSGKSATGLAIMDLLDPAATRRVRAITLAGRRIDTLDALAMNALRGREIAMVFQDPMTSLNPVMRIGDQMAEVLVHHLGLDRQAARRRAAEALADVAIRDPEASLNAYPHQFSGGMRQRVCIAIALLCRPQLIIADEPTTALDTLVQMEVMNLLTRATREAGAALLLISHNLPLVAHYATRGLVMHEGRIVETGPMRAILQAPREAYTRALVAALPERRRDAGSAVAETCRAGPPVIEAREARLSFRTRRGLFRPRGVTRAVDGVSLTIHAGETLALVGASGSGKSTLGRLLLRLHRPEGGMLTFRGGDMTRAEGARLLPLRRHAQMIFQDPYASLNPRQRILDIVAEPLAAHGEGDRAAREAKARATLAEVGLTEHAQRFPAQLSGGQRQRVAIARALVRDPDFLVADEPISALDMTIQKQVLELFRLLQARRGFACLFISHDLAAVGALADRIAVMQDGRIVEEGSRDTVLDAPRHPYTRALWAASFGAAATPSLPETAA
jgi:peptide/nickel transport system ATP-binding protein